MAETSTCEICGKEMPRGSDRVVMHYKQNGKMTQSTFCSMECASAWNAQQSEEKKELEDEIEKAVDETKLRDLKSDEEPKYNPGADDQVEGYQEMRQLIYENEKISDEQKKELVSEMKEEMHDEKNRTHTALSLVYDSTTNRYRKVMAPFSMVDKLKELKVIDDIYTRDAV